MNAAGAREKHSAHRCFPCGRYRITLYLGYLYATAATPDIPSGGPHTADRSSAICSVRFVPQDSTESSQTRCDSAIAVGNFLFIRDVGFNGFIV